MFARKAIEDGVEDVPANLRALFTMRNLLSEVGWFRGRVVDSILAAELDVWLSIIPMPNSATLSPGCWVTACEGLARIPDASRAHSRQDAKMASDRLRTYRNLVHPRAEKRAKHSADFDTADLCWSTVNAVLNDLAASIPA
ncbi:hypothetical protein [Streptomyces sp. SLBN-8D4]|uniref:hypothetical protein n=1 Tax=Streptomyces sp. SLBN-8D4 TaxID=3377728 RepID=UPI003C7B1ADB